MRLVVNLLGGLLAVGWAGVAADYAAGARRGRTLESQPPFSPDQQAPSLSIVVAACNEEEKIAPAFRSLMVQEYPGPLQIVAIDDRSTDRTPALLDELAQEAPVGTQVLVLHLDSLPPGWLGKNHALYQGAQRASGAWILFTDADVIFGPDALSRGVHLAEREKLDHLVAFFGLDLRGFWENVFGLAFSLFFFLRFRPWHVRNPRRKEYLGIGGFNLIRSSAYETIGTHRAIALEVADDMELGRRVKIAGLSSDVVGAKDLVQVRWQEGLGGLMNGLTKNAYAALHYSWAAVVTSSGLLLVTVVWPYIGLIAARNRAARAAYAFCTAAITLIGSYHARTGNIAPLYSLTLPFSTLLLIVVMFRSALTTERNGGITWRSTFYPLEVLRARAVPPPPPLIDA
ncbi:MAG: glycosyltransferase family 2 protein [Armatimonadota bacterium]